MIILVAGEAGTPATYLLRAAIYLVEVEAVALLHHVVVVAEALVAMVEVPEMMLIVEDAIPSLVRLIMTVETEAVTMVEVPEIPTQGQVLIISLLMDVGALFLGFSVFADKSSAIITITGIGVLVLGQRQAFLLASILDGYFRQGVAKMQYKISR